MSTRSKGRKHELEYKLELEKQGYIVELVKGSSRFSKSVDFFGLFDGFAISKKDCILFQVKTNISIKDGGKSKLLTDITKWAVKNPLNDCFKLQVVVRYTKPDLKKRNGGIWKVIDLKK